MEPVLQVLVVMPFGKQTFIGPGGAQTTDFDSIYRDVIIPGVNASGNVAVRADELTQSGDITTQFLEKVVSSEIMIADLSMPNGNVYFELGIRQSMSNHPTILIAAEGTVLPFDIRNQRILFYKSQDAVDRTTTAQTLARWIGDTATNTVVNPIQTHLKALALAADPNDAVGFEADLRGKVERAQSIEQLTAVWNWAKPINPLPPFTLLALAEKFARLLAWQTAADVVRVARDLRPTDFEIHRVLGWYLRNCGEGSYKDAEQSFREALRLNRGDIEALGMLGGLLKRQGRYGEAAEIYAQGVAEDPSSLYLRVAHAGMSLMANPKENAKAIELYGQLAAVALDSERIDDAWAHSVAAEAEFVRGNDERALEEFLAARGLADNPTVLASPADQLRLFADAGFRPKEALELAARLDALAGDIASSSTSPVLTDLPIILHLSDTHFGYKIVDGKSVDMHRFREGDYSTTLDQHLIDEIVGEDSPLHLKPERLYVVVSGDLVYRADQPEYEEALACLKIVAERLALPLERFIFCPGNHDVSWADAKIDLTRRLDNYLSFLVRFYGLEIFRKLYPLVKWDFTPFSDRPEPSEVIGIHDFAEDNVLFVSFNSCVYESDQNHYGFVGGKQLRKAKQLLAGRASRSVRVAVLHHHLHPYPEFGQADGKTGHWVDQSTIRDAGIFERFLERAAFDLVLHGHKHKAQLRETVVRDQAFSKAKRLIVCGAGSSGVQSSELEHSVPNQYQIIELLTSVRIERAPFIKIDWRELPVTPTADWITSWSCLIDG